MKKVVQGVATVALSACLSAQGYALRLGPNTVLEFVHNPIMHTGNASTMEYWVRSDGSQSGISWARYKPSQEHKTLNVEQDGSIGYLYAGSPWWQSPTLNGGVTLPPAGTVPSDSTWHHVAFVRRAVGTWSLYVDGLVVVGRVPVEALAADAL